MVTSFECSCGNTDTKKVYEYDGCLGYQALICTCCGRYYDNEGMHLLDEFSKPYITNKTEIMEENIEEVLYPENGELQADNEGTLTTTIVDAELDGIECRFNNDNGVVLDTEGYQYLSLSKANLKQLIELIETAEEVYKNMPDPE